MNTHKLLLLLLFSVTLLSGNAQELMQKVEDNDVSILLNNTTVVTLNDSSQLVGTLTNIYLMKGHLIDFSLKLQDESKRKFKPTEIISVKIRCAKPTVFSVVDDSGNVLKKVINTQFVFEHPFKTSKKVKPEMMQLLNPAFDKRIKVFPDPEAGVSRSISIKGKPLQEGSADSYILVKGEDVIFVKRKTYTTDFNHVYGDCPKVLESIPADQIIFEGLAGHVFLYDYNCGPNAVKN